VQPRVWAPIPSSVTLVLDDRRLPMRRSDDGWWTAEVDLPPDTDYSFALDDDPAPLPDPRSQWQPNGIQAPSRVVDHAAFRWTDSAFDPPSLASGVIYELHVGTFTEAGTFEAVIDHLDDLVDLGISHVELMPIAEFSGDRGWGYDAVDLFAPHHRYGGPDGLKRLVDACHAHGLAVLLDVVYNHLGPAGNVLERFGPYLTSTHISPWGAAVNFDAPGSDEVRRFVIDNALQWLRDYHADGLRLDAIHAIVDTSATHILEELVGEVRALERRTGRTYVVIAESDLNDPRLVREPAAGGYGLDGQWADDVHHALHVALTGERGGYYADYQASDDLAKALREPYVYDGRVSAQRGRRHGRPPEGVPLSRFIAFLQNHDQIGNRATGDRIARLTSLARARVGAALLLTAPYVPLLFMGEEWAASTPFLYFTDHADPELGEAVRTGRRAEFAAFGWEPEAVPDPQDPATFQRSRLQWTERDADEHAEMLEWYRLLVHFRRSTPDLLDDRPGQARVSIDAAARSIILRRGRVRIVANLGRGELELAVLDGARSGAVALASAGSVALSREGVLRLPADSAAIVLVEDGGSAPGAEEQ
jgi:maltooligosyltrehalose trehalohydrolase